MHWAVAAAFTTDATRDLWLTPFVGGSRHHFVMIPARRRERSWHLAGRRVSGLHDWRNAFAQAGVAWQASRGGGVITVFPQLALAVGIRQRASFRERPIIAWCFNLGALYDGPKGAMARFAMAHIDRFIVHARGEAPRYADWLGIPRDRFRFVHLQRAAIPIDQVEDVRSPFVLAMGSARRDYASLFEAVRASKHPTVVVAARHALEGLSVPNNVKVHSGLSPEDCLQLAQRARISVIPVLNEETASGQVTLVEAMRMGRPIVATRCLGTEDYVENEVTGLLVEPRSPDTLRLAIERAWDDAELRQRLGRNAERFASDHCSDEAAGEALRGVLDEVENERAGRHDRAR